VMEAPPDYFDKFSTHYAFDAAPFSNDIIEALLSITQDSNAINNDNGTILATIVKELRLGNAMDLTQAIYDRWKTGKPFPDFNLDGDRGYAYLCWSQKSASSVDASDFPKELSVNANPAATVDLRFIK
jgi:hypothetical protein